MQLTSFQMMTCSGGSSGSAAVDYNASVPTDPLVDICLAQLPSRENNPLSARSRSSQIKTNIRIGVGLLPYIAIASVWRRRRPAFTNLAASRMFKFALSSRRRASLCWRGFETPCPMRSTAG